MGDSGSVVDGPRGSSRWQTAQLIPRWERIEAELALFERRVRGAQFWPIVRARVFYELNLRLAVQDNGELSAHKSLYQRGRRELRPVLQDLLKRREAVEPGFDTVLIPLLRKQIRAGQTVDIHSERICSEREFGRILILDQVPSTAARRADRNVTVGDYGRLRSLSIVRAALRAPLLLAEVAAERRRLNSHLLREFGIDCPMSAAQMAMRVAYFIEGRKVMRHAFRRSGARRLFFAGNQTPLGVAAAAKDLGMETIELQHGAIAPQHLTHHFAGRPEIPMMADRILLFGPFWAGNVDLPRNMSVTVIGSDNLARARNVARTVQRRALIISQMPTDYRLLQLTVAAAASAGDWEFTFRPHPFEDLSAYEARFARSHERLANLRLSRAEEDIYALLASAELQIGVCSTTLFEGLALGKRTIVLALPGHELMENVLSRGDAVLARDAQELVAHLDDAPIARSAEIYYAAPVPSIAQAIAQSSSC